MMNRFECVGPTIRHVLLAAAPDEYQGHHSRQQLAGVSLACVCFHSSNREIRCVLPKRLLPSRRLAGYVLAERLLNFILMVYTA
jgi:hypothetical protein